MEGCHYINDPEFGRVHIPGCYSGAMNPGNCVCPKRVKLDRLDKIERQLNRLERAVATQGNKQ